MIDTTHATCGSNTTGPLLLTETEIDAVSGGWTPREVPTLEIIGGGVLGGGGLLLIGGVLGGVILVGAAPIVLTGLVMGGMVATAVGALGVYDGIQKL